ncbi:1482_t:CDS:2, partial [Cetraspora pellucida]
DIDDFLNNEGELNLDVEGERNKDDQYKNYLLRNNCILYGAPGTGKTEFVRELNHVLIDRYGIKPNELPDSDDLNDPANAWKKDKEKKEDNLPKPQVPVFQINGLDISSTGKDEPKIYEKLILCLKKLKNDFFKVPDGKGEIGEFSNLPYIAFIDEADQAKNPFTFRPENKNNLEELKNFFSTSEDSQGLRANAQDPNSIFVIATNNYETIDPAMKRRGRLGKSLNFTFNPLTLQKYSEELAEKMNFDNIREKFIPKTQKMACEGIEDEKEKQEIREEELKRKLTACEGEHEAQQLENYNHPNQTERYEFDKGRLLRERLQQFQKDVYETSVDLINVCGEELRRNSEALKQLNSLQEGSYEILSGIEKNLGEIETQIRDYVRAKIND